MQKAKKRQVGDKANLRPDRLEVDLLMCWERRETPLLSLFSRIDDSHGAALQWSASGLKCRVNW